ncbi:MAG: hypothetical protein KGH52_01105 [Candidatus Micrarchaeota archaeon]|nr:hypothetical protein [Candidatus Micrarchaeota archaeon]
MIDLHPLLPFIYIISFTLLLYRVAVNDKPSKLAQLAVFLIIGIILAIYQGANLMLFISILILFDLMAHTFGSKSAVVLSATGIVFIIIASQAMHTHLIAQAILLGLLAEVNLIGLKQHNVANKKVETRRDLVQIGFGILIIGMLHFFNISRPELAVILLILLGYLVANYANTRKDGRVGRYLFAMERKYTKFGEGASMLAIGTLLAFSFVFDAKYIMIVISAIFIGDALATIIGMRWNGIKLPYNKKKSLAGSIAYFAAVMVLPYLLYGIVAVPIAIIATLVESLPIKTDDNLSVPAVLIAIYLLVEILP